MDTELLKNQIQGLKSSIQGLRETERIFIKSDTLKESIAKAQTASDVLEEGLEVVKKQKSDLKDRRAAILRDALDPLAHGITALLPRGEAVVSLDERLFIGWRHDGKVSPYLGLSGGEKVFFDGALSAAMLKDGGQKILVLEAAELDDANLVATLQKIAEAHPDAQVLVNTCYAPKEVVPGWKVIRL